VLAKGEAGTRAAPESFSDDLKSTRSGGRSLGYGLRRPFERAMSADFTGVRIHTDAGADRLSRSIRARAFTTGSDIYFSRGAYTPATPGGQRLLAHELAHVAQQRRSGAPGVVQRITVDHITGTEDVTQRDRGHRKIMRTREGFDARAARILGDNPALKKKLSSILHTLEYDVDAPGTTPDIRSLRGELDRVHQFLTDKHTQLQSATTPDVGAIAANQTRLNDLGERGELIRDLKSLRRRYLRSTKRYFSHADPSIEITEDNGVISSVSTSSQRYFGNIHAIAYLEYLDNGTPRTIMAHIPGGATSYQVSPFDVHDVQGDPDTLAKLGRSRRKRAWERSKLQILAAKAKADRVKHEGETEQKYEYRREGTGLAFHSHRDGEWGWRRRQVINCARYVEKILKASGLPVDEVSSGSMLKTPQQVALGTTGGGDLKRWFGRQWSKLTG
jgi:hypothetical protein